MKKFTLLKKYKIALSLVMSLMLTAVFFAQATSATSTGYQIVTRTTRSSVLAMAIHGGKIEPGTSELANALAKKNNYNYYSLMGELSSKNSLLHVTATKFNETTALKMAAKSTTTVSVHGCAGTSKFTYVGGRDAALVAKIKSNLKKSGFVCLTPPSDLSGTAKDNICNKNKTGKGVQLEISNALRKSFVSNNATLQKYAAAISSAINSK